MKQEELFRKISEETDIGQEQVEQVYDSMVHIITDVLAGGEEVALNPEWGIFIPKLWDNPGMNEGSPRTRQQPRYKIRFRPGKEMEKKLRLPEMKEKITLPQGGEDE